MTTLTPIPYPEATPSYLIKSTLLLRRMTRDVTPNACRHLAAPLTATPMTHVPDGMEIAIFAIGCSGVGASSGSCPASTVPPATAVAIPLIRPTAKSAPADQGTLKAVRVVYNPASDRLRTTAAGFLGESQIPLRACARVMTTVRSTARRSTR